jgi:hypothetical protein
MFRAFSAAVLLLLAATAALAGPPPGRVLVEICEDGVPKDNTWPSRPGVTETYEEELFGLVDLPQKYISTGVRADRAFPTLVRASAEVALPAGKHRVAARSRGQRAPDDRRPGGPRNALRSARGSSPWATRANCPSRSRKPSSNLGPGYRHAPPGIREVWGIYEVTSTARSRCSRR